MLLAGSSIEQSGGADLIYRKSLLEEKEMPKAQLRPSGGSPSAHSREVAVGSGVGAPEPPRLAGRWTLPCSRSTEDVTGRARVTGSRPGPKTLRECSRRPARSTPCPRECAVSMHWMIDKKGHHFSFNTNTNTLRIETRSCRTVSSAKIRDCKERSSPWLATPGLTRSPAPSSAKREVV